MKKIMYNGSMKRIWTLIVSKGCPVATIPIPPKHPAIKSLANSLAGESLLLILNTIVRRRGTVETGKKEIHYFEFAVVCEVINRRNITFIVVSVEHYPSYTSSLVFTVHYPISCCIYVIIETKSRIHLQKTKLMIHQINLQ